MKFKNIMFSMISVFILSMLSNLYFNMKINVLSSDLEQIRNEILQLEIEKSKVHLIGNIEKLSEKINFKRLDVHNKNFDLVRPYKIIEDSGPVIVMGFGK